MLTLSTLTSVVAQEREPQPEEKAHAKAGMDNPSDSERKQDSGPRGRGKSGARYKAFVQRFDLDQDGKLSKEERAKAQKMMQRLREKKRSQMRAIRKHYIVKFDSDGDGELSEDEKNNAREEARAQMAALKANFIKLYDADGDGKLSEQERQAGHKQEKLKMLKRFDSDGNGELDAAEKKAAFDYMVEHEPHRLMHEMRGYRRAHGRKHGGRARNKRPQPPNAEE